MSYNASRVKFAARPQVIERGFGRACGQSTSPEVRGRQNGGVDLLETPEAWVDAIAESLEPMACPTNAISVRAYMKDVSPFLGIKTPARRAAVKAIAATQPRPSADTLRSIAVMLWAEPMREFQYAACDLLARYHRDLPEEFLADPVASLLTAKPWWDTVDALGTAVVSPLTMRYPDLVDLMWQWCRSDDRWLIRAAIQHQRGRRDDTDTALLFAMCEPHVEDREFFIAKAIGWALRDTSRWFPDEVADFVAANPQLSPVALREAKRGLERAEESAAGA